MWFVMVITEVCGGFRGSLGWFAKVCGNSMDPHDMEAMHSLGNCKQLQEILPEITIFCALLIHISSIISDTAKR